MNYEAVCKTAPATPGLLITKYLNFVENDMLSDEKKLLSKSRAEDIDLYFNRKLNKEDTI